MTTIAVVIFAAAAIALLTICGLIAHVDLLPEEEDDNGDWESHLAFARQNEQIHKGGKMLSKCFKLLEIVFKPWDVPDDPA